MMTLFLMTILAVLLGLSADRALRWGLRRLTGRLERNLLAQHEEDPSIRLVASEGRPVIRRAIVNRYQNSSDEYFEG